MPNIHTHQVKRIRQSVFYHVVSNHLNISLACFLGIELKMIHDVEWKKFKVKCETHIQEMPKKEEEKYFV